MRKLSAISVGVVSLLLAVPAAIYAQDEPKPQQEEKAEPRQDEPKPKEAAPPKQEQPKAEPNRPDEAKPSKQDEKATKQQQESNRSDQMNSKNGQGAMASGKTGGRIPDKDFKSHFGRSHTVVINQPTVVEGQPRFQYSGYWFVISQPWPSGWLYTDQCYIDFVDGEYVLFDLSHPGVSIVLEVVM